MLHISNLTAETMIKTIYEGLTFFDPGPDSNYIRIVSREKVECFYKRGERAIQLNNWGSSVIMEAARDGVHAEYFSLALVFEMSGAHNQGETVICIQMLPPGPLDEVCNETHV